MREYFNCFLAFTVFCATLIVQDVEAHGGCCASCNSCYFPKSCSLGPRCRTDNTTIHITNIWEKVPVISLTENMKTLRQQLIATSNGLNDQGPAFGATVFVVELLLGFQVQPDPTCVLLNLIRKVVAEKEGCTEGLVQAIQAFGLLNQQGLHFSRTDILVDIKCKKRPNPNSCSCKCWLENELFKKIMQLIKAPDSLKNIITKLYLSQNPEEQRLAIAVIALFTEHGVQLFNSLLSTINYRIGLQYFACLGPVPHKCCSVRYAEFNKIIDRALLDNRRIIEKITSKVK